jgi:hypothetical protein
MTTIASMSVKPLFLDSLPRTHASVKTPALARFEVDYRSGEARAKSTSPTPAHLVKALG